MRRFCLGLVTKQDIWKINERYYENSSITFPPIAKIRCACYMNDERNAYNNVVFMQHLRATHHKADSNNITCPNHTCIIKANMKYGSKQIGSLSKSMYNHLLDECGDSDITNGSKAFVDPALKFFHNIPLMMNTNARIDEELANGTPCCGLYIKLKKGSKFKQENWEGYMVNAVYANQVDYIVCMQEGKNAKYLETRQCQIKLRRENSQTLSKIKLHMHQ